VVLAAIVIFSVLVGISGLATSLVTLMLVRAIMGLADGAYTPPSIVATLEASKPARQGRNIGIQQMMLPFFGLALAPLIVTQLLEEVSWRWIFLMVTPFGLAIAAVMYFVLRPPAQLAKIDHTAVHDMAMHKWKDLFYYRNILHNMLGMLCWLTCLTVSGAMLPNYLIDYLHLSVPQMGFVMSAIGFGGSTGAVILPMLSDRIGRKPVMLMGTAGGAISMLLFMHTGASPGALFTCLLLTHFCNFALIILTVGPISVESVPVKLMAAASGLVICTGEVFGGGVAPVIAGFVAENFGIQFVLPLAIGALCVGFINSCFLRETAPRRVGKEAVLL
jgi:MFS family permease